MKRLIPVGIGWLILVGCGRMNALNPDAAWSDTGWVSADTGSVEADTDTDTDADADADSDADSDADADSDTDSDADSDTDTDADTDTDTPAPPTLTSLSGTDNGNSTVTVSFVADDANANLDGGQLNLTVQGSASTYTIPSQLDSWTLGGTSTITVPVTGGGSGGCSSTTNVAIDARVRDTTGLQSTQQSTSVTVGGGGTGGATSVSTTETGDDFNSQFQAGAIARGATITGSIWGAAYYVDIFTGAAYYDADVDFIAFEPCESGSWTFSLTWVAGSTDYDLALFDTGTNLLVYSEQGLGVQPETVSYSLTANTTYVLRVGGWEGSSGNWTITAN